MYKEIFEYIGVDKNFIPPNPNKAHYKGGMNRSKTLSKLRLKINEENIPFIPQMINLINVKGQASEVFFKKDKRGYPPMNPEVRKKLTEYFKPYNDELKKMYPRLDIEHWYKV